jgi:hypothetical protein
MVIQKEKRRHETRKMPFGLWTCSQDHNDFALINYAGSWFGWLMRPRLQPTRDLNSLWCVRYNKWTSGDSTHLGTFCACVPSGVRVLLQQEIKRSSSMTRKATGLQVYKAIRLSDGVPRPCHWLKLSFTGHLRAEGPDSLSQVSPCEVCGVPELGQIFLLVFRFSGKAVVQLRDCNTSWKVAGLIWNWLTEIYRWFYPSGRDTAQASTQPLTEMSTRNVSWCAGGWGVKATGTYDWQLCHLRVLTV